MTMFWLLLILAAIIGAAIYFRPEDHGLPHDPYFKGLEDSLKQDGPGHPVLVLDLDRLDQNIATSQAYFNEKKAFRIVAKSLPSLPLLQYIMDKAGTNKLMAFHRPFLNLMVRHLPNAEFLIGKPFPIQATQRFFAELADGIDPQNACDRIQWLVDSSQRAEQYLELAKARNLKVQLNVEIDVGLHRGGLTDPKQLDAILKLIQDNPQHLHFAGFMGYEPHIAKMPMGNPERIEKARQKAMGIYQNYINRVRNHFAELYHDDLTFNGAGSPTYQLYKNDNTLNDLCAGSSLVKPTDFDLATLTGKQPALFIATPVIKKLQGTSIPFIETFTPWISRYNPNWQESVFIYGGYWKAQPVSPKGLQNNSLYGRSSNQEILNMSARCELNQDDYVFLRPTQSEAVMLEFADLLVVRNGKIIDRWAVFSQDLVREEDGVELKASSAA